jgi:hypothetical protein
MDSIIMPIEPFPNPNNQQQREHNQFVKGVYENDEFRLESKGAYHITGCKNRCHVTLTHAQWTGGSFRCMGTVFSTEQFMAVVEAFVSFEEDLFKDDLHERVPSVEDILKKYEGWQP